jgi:hypothetical protein
MLDFGVEIEFIAPAGSTYVGVAAAIEAAGVSCLNAGYTHRAERERWKIVTDGSLRSMHVPGGVGMELVSPPLSEANFEQIEKVGAVLTQLGAVVNRSCGLHIHIGARNRMSVAALKKLAELYVQHECLIDQLLPPSRRGNANQYCGSNATRADMVRLNQATTVTEIASAVGGEHNRYVKLNFTAYWKHGTVEFRHHSGTVDAQKIIKWVIFCSKMVETAVREAGQPIAGGTHGIGERAYWQSGRARRVIYRLLSREEGATSEDIRLALGIRSQPYIQGHLRRAGAAEVVMGHRYGREVFKLDPTASSGGSTAPSHVAMSLVELYEKLQLDDMDKAFWQQRTVALGTAQVGSNGEIGSPPTVDVVSTVVP